MAYEARGYKQAGQTGGREDGQADFPNRAILPRMPKAGISQKGLREEAGMPFDHEDTAPSARHCR